jgi:hypothetical protein
LIARIMDLERVIFPGTDMVYGRRADMKPILGR